jgi:hypothetical protein
MRPVADALTNSPLLGSFQAEQMSFRLKSAREARKLP